MEGKMKADDYINWRMVLRKMADTNLVMSYNGEWDIKHIKYVYEFLTEKTIGFQQIVSGELVFFWKLDEIWNALDKHLECGWMKDWFTKHFGPRPEPEKEFRKCRFIDEVGWEGRYFTKIIMSDSLLPKSYELRAIKAAYNAIIELAGFPRRSDGEYALGEVLTPDFARHLLEQAREGDGQ